MSYDIYGQPQDTNDPALMEELRRRMGGNTGVAGGAFNPTVQHTGMPTPAANATGGGAEPAAAAGPDAASVRQRLESVSGGIPVSDQDVEDAMRLNLGQTVDSRIGEFGEQYKRRAASDPQPGGGSGQQSVTQQWLKPEVTAAAGAAATRNAQRNTDLWKMLSDQASQSTDINRNSAAVRPQADAYAANEQRAARSHVADLAESSGPYANITGERRLAAERVGQRTGAFEAEAVAREATRVRDEKIQAMQQMQSLLTADESMQLQREIAELNHIIQQQGIGLQSRGLDQNWQMALLNNDQFLADLGLRAEDRNSYWDAVRSGTL